MSEEKKSGNILKIVELGLEPQVYEEMRKPGFSAEALARKFEAEGNKISAHSIRKFINKTKAAQQELIQKDMRMSKELMKTAMDYNKALRTILDEVEEVKNDAKNEKDFTTYNQLVGRLLQGIELFAKLTGDMKPKGNIDINIIYNQINEEIDTTMRDTRKQMFDKVKTINVESEIVEEDKIVADKIQAGEEN